MASGSGGRAGSGGVLGSGGKSGSGGRMGSGGATGSGGRMGSGGRTGSGGALGSGGRMGSGGATGSGGVLGSGGKGSGGAVVTGSGGTTATVWKPAPNTSWQWQLTGTVDQTVDVQLFDIDLFDNDASVVASLHARGRKVICYMSAGSFEDWRPDASSFPAAVKGKGLDGWAGESWLDVRQLSTLGAIMGARLDLCKSKGFDGVEFDNVDGYSNNTGFPLTGADQLAYNRMLAQLAHARGLSAGLKNDLEQVSALVGDFDWALNEECFSYNECDMLQPFLDAGKAVFNTEYNLQTTAFCPQANAMNINSLKKNLDLGVYRVACR